MLSNDFNSLLISAEQSYRALLERSWALLIARTPPDNAEAIAEACELQAQLIRTGAAWLALCGRVRAMAEAAGTSPAADAEPLAAALGDAASGSLASRRPSPRLRAS